MKTVDAFYLIDLLFGIDQLFEQFHLRRVGRDDPYLFRLRTHCFQLLDKSLDYLGLFGIFVAGAAIWQSLGGFCPLGIYENDRCFVQNISITLRLAKVQICNSVLLYARIGYELAFVELSVRKPHNLFVHSILDTQHLRKIRQRLDELFKERFFELAIIAHYRRRQLLVIARYDETLSVHDGNERRGDHLLAPLVYHRHIELLLFEDLAHDHPVCGEYHVGTADDLLIGLLLFGPQCVHERFDFAIEFDPFGHGLHRSHTDAPHTFAPRRKGGDAIVAKTSAARLRGLGKLVALFD